jgi:hypothetical protein
MWVGLSRKDAIPIGITLTQAEPLGSAWVPVASATNRSQETKEREARRKSKHFEILGRSPKGEAIEFHVELDGAIRKRNPADLHEPTWKSAVPPRQGGV